MNECFKVYIDLNCSSVHPVSAYCCISRKHSSKSFLLGEPKSQLHLCIPPLACHLLTLSVLLRFLLHLQDCLGFRSFLIIWKRKCSYSSPRPVLSLLLEVLETTCLFISPPSAFLFGTCHTSLLYSSHSLSNTCRADPQNRNKKSFLLSWTSDCCLMSFFFSS